METCHLSNRICNTCLHASCVASTFDFADCSKKRDQCDIPLIATFFPKDYKEAKPDEVETEDEQIFMVSDVESSNYDSDE